MGTFSHLRLLLCGHSSVACQQPDQNELILVRASCTSTSLERSSFERLKFRKRSRQRSLLFLTIGIYIKWQSDRIFGQPRSDGWSLGWFTIVTQRWDVSPYLVRREAACGNRCSSRGHWCAAGRSSIAWPLPRRRHGRIGLIHPQQPQQ